MNQSEADSDSILFRRSITIDSKFASRMTIAAFRHLLFTPGRSARLMVPAVALGVFIALGVNAHGAAIVGVFLLGLLAIPALWVLVFLIAYFPARRQLSDRLPLGSEYSIVMSNNSMSLKDSMVATDVSYELYKSLRVSKDFVSLMPKRGRRPTLVPRELFTAESLAWLASRLSTIK
jgi:hypothetical protein